MLMLMYKLTCNKRKILLYFERFFFPERLHVQPLFITLALHEALSSVVGDVFSRLAKLYAVDALSEA